MRNALILTAQVTLLWLVSWAGHGLAVFVPVPLPGNVCGLLMMFLLLLTGIVPLRCVELGASFLLRHLALFFVPIVVGFTTFGDIIAKHGAAIVVTLIGSIAIGFAVTGRVCQSLRRWRPWRPVTPEALNERCDIDRT